jgi:hypothetical protein
MACPLSSCPRRRSRCSCKLVPVSTCWMLSISVKGSFLTVFYTIGPLSATPHPHKATLAPHRGQPGKLLHGRHLLSQREDVARQDAPAL